MSELGAQVSSGALKLQYTESIGPHAGIGLESFDTDEKATSLSLTKPSLGAIQSSVRLLLEERLRNIAAGMSSQVSNRSTIRFAVDMTNSKQRNGARILKCEVDGLAHLISQNIVSDSLAN